MCGARVRITTRKIMYSNFDTSARPAIAWSAMMPPHCTGRQLHHHVSEYGKAEGGIFRSKTIFLPRENHLNHSFLRPVVRGSEGDSACTSNNNN